MPAYKAPSLKLQRALEALLRSVTGRAQSAPASTDPWWRPKPHLRFVLLDDMSDLWRPFLSAALGIQKNQPLLALPGPAFADAVAAMPDRLSLFCRSRVKRTLSAKDLVETWPDTSNFVLFLDLRLFPESHSAGDGGNAKDRFMSQLADLGLSLLSSGRPLPWLLSEQRTALSCELNHVSRRDGVQPIGSALPPEETLFPRLLSVLDPSLPIVVFSSTHRSEFVEPFRAYGNVITTFRKPVISGMASDWSDTVAELRTSFRRTMDRAAKILQTRQLLESLSGTQIIGFQK